MATRPGDKHPALLALTSSALLLPVYQAARADAPPEFMEMGMRYSKYKEDDTQGKKTFGGSSERYDIDAAQFHLLAPVADNWSLAVDVQWEDMSGASPWFVGESLDGSPKVIMSGASIEDTRTEVSVTTRYYYDRGNAGLNYVRSDEDDYDSNAVALDGAVNSADGMTTYSGALSYSSDDIEPTQGSVPTNTLKADKDISSAWIGVSRIVSRNAIVRFGLSYTYRDGFLTDPYKRNDQRPGERKEWAISTGYRQFFMQPNGALQADYRYFDDDWGVASHTLNLAWHQNIGPHTQVIPFLRYYSQDKADFFANIADTDKRYFADDYRLSAFGAISGGLRVRHEIGNWAISAVGERYETDESWGVYNGEESPALVNYWRYSFGLDYIFK
jgi:hypothetical protein